MWRAWLITLHTATALIAFVSGCLAVWRRTQFPVYLWSLGAMFAFLAAALVIDWPDLEGFSRVVFAALTALGAYMVWRAVQASRLLSVQDSAARLRFIDHVGFTLIALFVGFVAIAVLDLGGPGWLVTVVSVASVAVGRAAISRVKMRAPSTPG